MLIGAPCSALNPTATAKTEERVAQLRGQYSADIVTHTMRQVARFFENTGFMCLGGRIESGQTDVVFSNAARSQARDCVTGRLG